MSWIHAETGLTAGARATTRSTRRPATASGEALASRGGQSPLPCGSGTDPGTQATERHFDQGDDSEAGGKHPHACAPILAQDDSAKAWAVAGLSVAGWGRSGVSP